MVPAFVCCLSIFITPHLRVPSVQLGLLPPFFQSRTWGWGFFFLEGSRGLDWYLRGELAWKIDVIRDPDLSCKQSGFYHHIIGRVVVLVTRSDSALPRKKTWRKTSIRKQQAEYCGVASKGMLIYFSNEGRIFLFPLRVLVNSQRGLSRQENTWSHCQLIPHTHTHTHSEIYKQILHVRTSVHTHWNGKKSE